MSNIYSDLNYHIMSFIGAAICAHDLPALHQLGLDDESIHRCSQLSLNQLQRLKSIQAPLARIEVDPRRFDLTLDYLDNEEKTSSIKDRMIKMQASAAMLGTLMGMDIIEYRSRRKKLGLDRASQGRPRTLTDDEVMLVSQAWSRYNDEKDLLMRYYKVGIETSLPLKQIWAFMQLDK